MQAFIGVEDVVDCKKEKERTKREKKGRKTTGIENRERWCLHRVFFPMANFGVLHFLVFCSSEIGHRGCNMEGHDNTFRMMFLNRQLCVPGFFLVV